MKKILKLLEKVTVCNSDMKDMKKPPHYLGTSLTLTLASKIEEYAEHQAIEFAEWVRSKYSYNYHPRHGVWMPGKLTTEQLYQKFKEEQT